MVACGRPTNASLSRHGHDSASGGQYTGSGSGVFQRTRCIKGPHGGVVGCGYLPQQRSTTQRVHCARRLHDAATSTQERQVPDAVEAPAVSPWDTVPLGPNPAAEAVVRNWLSQSWPLTTQLCVATMSTSQGHHLAFQGAIGVIHRVVFFR
jgi:hypothetical protein